MTDFLSCFSVYNFFFSIDSASGFQVLSSFLVFLFEFCFFFLFFESVYNWETWVEKRGGVKRKDNEKFFIK